MKKDIIYICEECGNEFLKWNGKCDVCGAWNSLKELKSDLGHGIQKVEPAESYIFSDIKTETIKRIDTKIDELNRVLGDGIVPGSVILLGGDPGIGKSTLALQLALKIPNVCYVTGEESLNQIGIRFERVSKNKNKLDKNYLIAETNLDSIEKTILKLRPSLVVIDSIQTMYLENFPSASGSLVQVRESALRIIKMAKRENIATIIIGHVTKDGDIAGPKILEHMVDVVLYLEGERYHDLRILRGLKNRFGDATEIGIFKMDGTGLVEMPNPSSELLAERLGGPGSIVTATIEGTRPFLVEIQALVNQSIFGYPKRSASGLDVQRLDLLLAVMKKFKVNLNSFDVYLNAVGGMKIKEPAVDLAIIVSLASVLFDKSVNKNLCIFGEVGLSGEIRKVRHQEKRENEALRLGYEILPKFKSLDKCLSFLFDKL
ncbi:MAG: DNA repair protein RadA [Patescibacteria group bacterium]|jgi:DNA repair protein RadA/Sms